MCSWFQIGESYTCWCNVIDPYKAKWDQPSTLNGLVILICGGVATILCFVGIFFGIKHVRILFTMENKENSQKWKDECISEVENIKINDIEISLL